MSAWKLHGEWPDGPDWPDAALRDVNPPRGLMTRLGAIPVESDEDLDRLLCDVPTPPGLVGRLCQIGAAQDGIHKRREQVEQKAVAAALAATAWCAYAAALILFWAADYPFARANSAGRLQTAAMLESDPDLAESASLAILDESAAARQPPAPEEAAANALATDWPRPGSVESASGEQLLAFYWSGRSSSDYDFSALVDAPGRDSPRDSAAAIPQGAGFDRDFLARTGVFPRIDPRDQPWNRPPLAVEGDSFEFARRCFDRGQWPPAEEIRTEDFLAAIEFDFDRPQSSALALVAAGGPTAWPASDREGSFRLLQLGVQAKGPRNRAARSGQAIVANDVRMSVRFNPRAVKSYRLCGHEPTHREGPETPRRDFLTGQAATAVYELELQNHGEAEVATVSLEWRDAASGEQQLETRRVFAGDFAGSFGESNESVQLAALAVAAAEVLRRSPFAAAISPAETLALARQAAADAKRPLEFVRFVDLFERISLAGRRHRAESEDRGPLP